ncbi:MAG: RNA polymerase sigma-70 factor [Chitinophagaceae bacterium]|nr:MAG: RNA polymerase sigma-70 factor [Chitinophagaceae bacterium]
MQSTPPYNEELLLRRIASGEQEAYRQVFELYWNHVYAVGLKILKSPELAKDLSQDIFMKVWHNREQLSGINNFKAYLHTLSRNLAIDQLRKKVFTVDNEEYLLDYFSIDHSSQSTSPEYKELEQLLHQAVDNLPPQMQQVFRLSRFEGLTHAQIADRMKITSVTSKSYMVRALASIRTYLAQYQYQPLFAWVFILAIE